jgi:preprotein translocase subunit SecB
MSDEQPQQPAGGGPGPGATPQQAPPVQVTSQYVKDLSFENPNAPNSLQPNAGSPKITLNIDIQPRQIDENQWEVLLLIKVDAKQGEQQAYVVELSYGGVVSLSGFSQDQMAAIIFIEVPRLFFPFARSVVTEAIRDGGFPPLLIQPIDFVALYRRRVEALRARQEGGGGETPGQDGSPAG